MRTYEQLKEICMFAPEDRNATNEEISNKCIVSFQGVGYGYHQYRICNRPKYLHLTNEEIALFCDNGNLCFGFAARGNIIYVYTD